jgi:hypothetical protein
LSALLRDLFCLANAHLLAGEEATAERLSTASNATSPLSGFALWRSSSAWAPGSVSLSGVYDQIDSTAMTRRALVLGGWKAYRGALPKNDLRRFKAATDYYWLGQHAHTSGGDPGLRRDWVRGARPAPLPRQWGIGLLTPERWPAPQGRRRPSPGRIRARTG